MDEAPIHKLQPTSGPRTDLLVCTEQGQSARNSGAVVAPMKKAVARPIKKLAGARDQELLQAVFVRKLEAAGIAKHRSARAAFYMRRSRIVIQLRARSVRGIEHHGCMTFEAQLHPGPMDQALRCFRPA